MRPLLLWGFFLLVVPTVLAASNGLNDWSTVEWKTVFEAQSDQNAAYFLSKWVKINEYGVDPYFDQGWNLSVTHSNQGKMDQWGAVGTTVDNTIIPATKISDAQYVRFGFTLKWFGSDQNKIPAIRLRLNRVGGEHQWKISESLHIVTSNMKKWNQGEEQTFYLIVNLDDYPIKKEKGLDLGILAAVDLIVPPSKDEKDISGGVRLTRFVVEANKEQMETVKTIYEDNLRNRFLAQKEWTIISRLGTLPPIPVTYDPKSYGYRFMISHRFEEPASTQNVQSSAIKRKEKVFLTDQDLINRFSLQFFKSLGPIAHESDCLYAPTIRLRVSTQDGAFKQEREYYFITDSFPLNYPARFDSRPLELLFSPSNAQPFTNDRLFGFTIEALNYDRKICNGSTFTVNQASLTTLANGTN